MIESERKDGSEVSYTVTEKIWKCSGSHTLRKE